MVINLTAVKSGHLDEVANEIGILAEAVHKKGAILKVIIETCYLTEEEKTCLQIRKGTLTAEERGVMESHVRMTDRILSKVYFNRSFKNSPVWAAQHHECIDGSGYPNKLQGEDLCMEYLQLQISVTPYLQPTDHTKNHFQKKKLSQLWNRW